MLVEVRIWQYWDAAGRKGVKNSSRAGWRRLSKTSIYPLAYMHTCE